MKRDYMTQLSKWVRWTLPRQEAEDVIADYYDIIGDPPRSEEELIRDLGKPRIVAKAVTQPKQYRIWLAVFSTLAIFATFPIVMAYNNLYWNQIINPTYMMFLCLGIGLSLWNFRRNRERKGKLPRGIVPLLALLLIGITGTWLSAGFVLTAFWEILKIVPTTNMAQAIHLSLRLGIPAMASIALYGLVKARLDDHRWCAVYILGLSGVLLGLSFRLLLCSMDLRVEPGWQTPFLIKYAFITILGLIGAGAALC